nr:MAG TPA: hypothetical protein [Caudoviricetes sp.]
MSLPPHCSSKGTFLSPNDDFINYYNTNICKCQV